MGLQTNLDNIYGKIDEALSAEDWNEIKSALNDLDVVIGVLGNKTKWTYVTDRLPEEGIEVLVLATSGYMEVKHYVKDMNAWYPGGLPVGNTSHWMFLPKPPKEEKK